MREGKKAGRRLNILKCSLSATGALLLPLPSAAYRKCRVAATLVGAAAETTQGLETRGLGNRSRYCLSITSCIALHYLGDDYLGGMPVTS